MTFTDDIPAAIHPQSTPSQQDDRVSYENWVNAETEVFAETARHRFRDALLAGLRPEDVSIEVRGEHDGDDDTHIADATAQIAAVEAGLVPYSDWRHDDLAEECRRRGLKVSGTNDELIDRLEADDLSDAEELTE